MNPPIMGHADQYQFARIKRRCLSILPFTSFISILTLVTYVGTRIKCMLATDHETGEQRSVWTAWLYLVVELGFLGKIHLKKPPCQD